MYRFLAKVGRSKYFELVMPMMTTTVTTIYIGIQFGCHDQLRDLLGAQSPSGRREKISDHLRELIKQTHLECLDNGFNYLGKPLPYISLPQPQIKWFASSTLEPITFGCARFSWGALIGLPNFFNYTSHEDIPDSMFEIKMMSLFRSVQDRDLEKKNKLEEKKVNLAEHEPNLTGPRRIKRDTEDGQEFANSLLLSDDAKKFSIARELFLADTYRILFKAGTLFLALSTSVAVSREFVKRVGLQQAHITRRIPVYMTSAALAWGINHFGSILNDQLNAQRADSKAKKLGLSYEAGAKEYYEKRAKRMQILRIN